MPKSPIDFNKVSDKDIDKNIASQLSPPEVAKQAKKYANKASNLEKQLNKATKVSSQIDSVLRAKEYEYDKLGIAITNETIKYAHLISKNCKEALAAYQKTQSMLYRGIHNPGKKAFTSYPRNDRAAKDTNVEIHEFVDTLMSQHFMATRTNSIFCTSSSSSASGYGTVYIIFPFDGFDFTWSTKYTDMTVHVFENHRSVSSLIMSEAGLKEEVHSLQDTLQNVVNDIADLAIGDEPLPLQDHNYKQQLFTGLQTFERYFYSRNIPTVDQCKRALDLIKPMEMTDWNGTAFVFMTETIEKIIFSLEYVNTSAGSKEILDNWGMSRENFTEAIESEHEILIRSRYYAFKRAIYEDAFRKILLGVDQS